jgi:hypothetical protein
MPNTVELSRIGSMAQRWREDGQRLGFMDRMIRPSELDLCHVLGLPNAQGFDLGVYISVDL